MAGLVTTPIQPYNMNASPTTGSFFAALPSTYGYDNGAGIQAWGSNNVILVPNTGNVWLWYYCGATTAAGIAQVLPGQVVAGEVVAPVTCQTIPVSSSGWLAPFSPALYNIDNINIVPTNALIAGSPTITTWPAAALGCLAFAFTTTTQLLVRAYDMTTVSP
jgi:hypothetical protein